MTQCRSSPFSGKGGPIRPASVALATLLACLIMWGAPDGATAQPAGEPSAQELAKQLANPVASLISVPFQNNWDFNVGPAEDTRYLLNFQPVMPFSLNEKWNLIARERNGPCRSCSRSAR